MRPMNKMVTVGLVFAFTAGCQGNDGPSQPPETATAAASASAAPAASSATPAASANAAPSASPSGSASASATPEAPTGPQLWMVAADPTTGAKQPGAIKVGCDDWLVAKPIALVAADKKGQLVEATTKLLAEIKSKLTIASVKDAPDGSFALDLKGALAFGGTCDPPRLITAVEKTVGQFGKVTISVNGQTKVWRCAGDESGKCK